MNVLFITRGFPSETNPMSGNYEAVQAKALASKGHQVSVLNIRWRSLRYLFKKCSAKHKVVDGVAVYEYESVRSIIPRISLPKFELWWRRFCFDRIFKQYLNEAGRPDVVHAHIIAYASFAVCVKKKYNLPFVITEHWSKVLDDDVSSVLSCQAQVYKLADQVICVSSALADSIKRRFNVDSIVINNMVSDLFFKTRKMSHEDGEFRFIAVGALRKDKCFDILIDSFARCNFPNYITLAIVGGGDEQQTIEEKIKEYGLESQVKLLGVKTPEEVSGLLCQSDCYVLSSRLETFAIVVIEALAKGLPAIATRCGGPESFMRPEDGLLIPKEDVNELSKAMQYMFEHYKDYDTEEIRQHCYDSFSQDVIADKIIEVYNKVCHGSSNKR